MPACSPTPPPVPVAPGRLPLLGHALPLARRPLEFMDGLREQGPVVRVHLGTTPAYVVTGRDATRTMLVTDPKPFVKGGRIIEALRLFFGDGLATIADGDAHRRHRRLMQPMFNKAHIAGRCDAMVEYVREAVEGWPEGSALQVYQEMNDLTLNTFLVALFGGRVPAAVRQEFTRLLPKVMRGTIRHTLLPRRLAELPLPAAVRHAANVRRLRELVEQAIEHERDQPDGHAAGLFRALVAARDDETGEGLSGRQLQDEVITLLTGSVETTGSILSWALYEIARDPQVERRVLEEIAAVGGRPPGAGDLPTFEYTRRVLHETMRLYGPAWLVTRRTTAEVTLGGHRIPAGSDVVYSPYLLQRDPEVFPHPGLFDPDRWSPQRAAAIPRTAFLAFGAGTRQCIGESFAWTELLIMLAVILSRWRLVPAPWARVDAVAHVTVHPGGLVMTPYRRLSGQ